MSRRSYLAWSVLICLALSATPLAAEDVFPAPWSPTLLNQTIQVWDATVGWIPDAAIGANPGYQNDYGWPGAWFGGDWDSETVIGQRGEEIPTYHVADEGCYLLIHIPNHNEDNPLKLVHWQITADKSVTPGGLQPTSDPIGTATAGPTKDDWGVGTWCTYSGTLEIRPNPDLEEITFSGLEPGTHISEIDFKTVCIPEPGALALLATGAFGLLVGVWRRRNRAV